MAPAQVVCIIGASGSGKSTLLRCVNRLEDPTAGRIIVDGVDVTDPDCELDDARAHMGMVFQQFNLFPHKTVLGNVTLAQRKVLPTRRRRGRGGGPAAASTASAWPRRPTPTRPS